MLTEEDRNLILDTYTLIDLMELIEHRVDIEEFIDHYDVIILEEMEKLND